MGMEEMADMSSLFESLAGAICQSSWLASHEISVIVIGPHCQGTRGDMEVFIFKSAWPSSSVYEVGVGIVLGGYRGGCNFLAILLVLEFILTGHRALALPATRGTTYNEPSLWRLPLLTESLKDESPPYGSYSLYWAWIKESSVPIMTRSSRNRNGRHRSKTVPRSNILQWFTWLGPDSAESPESRSSRPRVSTESAPSQAKISYN